MSDLEVVQGPKHLTLRSFAKTLNDLADLRGDNLVGLFDNRNGDVGGFTIINLMVGQKECWTIMTQEDATIFANNHNKKQRMT